MRSLLFSLPVLAGALVACGGKVVIDVPPGSSGSGGASSSSASSSSSSASSSSSSGVGGSPTCPDPFPGVEAPCGVEGMICPVPNACCNGNAVCKAGLWTFDGPFCDDCEPDCGPNFFACAPGAVCAVYLSFTTTYGCEKDPCSVGSLSCACAAPICEAAGMICNNTSDFQVYCECTTC